MSHLVKEVAVLHTKEKENEEDVDVPSRTAYDPNVSKVQTPCDYLDLESPGA